MEHFVGYHNSDKQGRFNDGLPAPDGQRRRWDTNHRFKEATIVGNRLWVIEGQDSPKRFSLVTTGVMSSITPVGQQPVAEISGGETSWCPPRSRFAALAYHPAAPRRDGLCPAT